MITGDINAKSKLWGSPCTDERGLMIEGLIDINNASVINTGQPTYQHYDGSRSHLDVSIVSNCLAAKSNCGLLNNTMTQRRNDVTTLAANTRFPPTACDTIFCHISSMADEPEVVLI